VSGTTVTYTAAGSCVIDANQAGTGSYAAAPQVQQTITVSAVPQPISSAPATVPTPKPARTPTAASTPTTPTATPTPTTSTATPTPTTPTATPTSTQTSSPPVSFGWTAGEAPLPAGAASNPGVGLGSVACPSASSCVAVGSYFDSSGNYQGLLLTGSGTSWTAAEAPLPAGAAADPGASLGSVACPSASSCVAAGIYTDPSGNWHVLLLTGSGTSWTATEAPLPAGAAGASLGSVACPSASSCVAAGSSTDSSGSNQEPLLVTGSGTSWAAAEASLPGGAGSSADLGSVACPSASFCVAVGGYTDSSGNRQGLLVSGPG
jgi:hypothetical protein